MNPRPRTAQPLPPSALHRACDPRDLPFETTRDLEDLEGVLGQERAVEALRFALGMRHPHYNLFVLGAPGTGRHRLVRRVVQAHAATQPTPDDWCYVHDFETPAKPRALRLPPGQGNRLREDVERLVEALHAAIRTAFDSEDYRQKRASLENEYKQMAEEAVDLVREDARRRDVALVNTPGGVALAPLRDGEVMTADEVDALPEDERARVEASLRDLRERLHRTLHLAPQWERRHRERLRNLDRLVTAGSVEHLVAELRARWAAHPPVVAYLDAVKDDVIEHSERFLEPGERPSRSFTLDGQAVADEEDVWRRRYGVNVLVDHEKTPGAPIVCEANPTLPALGGRIEHMARLGALFTDFTLIRPGALHRANGGYLILDAEKVLTQPFSWELIKRVLRAREHRIEGLAQMLSPVTTVSLEPEPIPMDLKVILVGTREVYYLLERLDPEFGLLFQVPADTEEHLDRDGASTLRFARFVATLVREDGLRPFDRGAVAQVISRAARLAGDATKLSAQQERITDLLRSADHYAAQAGSPVVEAQHVAQAIDADRRRRERLRDRALEETLRDHVRIETDGARVGQVNGLVALSLGRASFGRPVRITVRTWLGRGGVRDIEREVELGGPVHAKGVLILSGFVGARYCRDRPLALGASVVFEQSYGPVEGDSASLAETCALLSAVGEVPLRQDVAITGSVDQHGNVQAVGAVNEKIEGFFDLCHARGLTGRQGVILPRANIEHLMLRESVCRAAVEGRFHVWAVGHVDEALALLGGVEVGERGADGCYPRGSFNQRVEARLSEYAAQAQRYGQDRGGDRR